MTNRTANGLEATRLLKQQSVGVLSTHSIDVKGYPFGSITPYTLNHDGEPLLLISDIAQHTRNIRHNPRVSLTIFDIGADDPQAGSRLTWIGDAELVSSNDLEARRRYLSYFPSAEGYFETHDFALYLIKLRRARFIGGFGQIFWVEPDSMLMVNPLKDAEARIVEHMNSNRRDALFDFCRVHKGVTTGDVLMAGIDSEGFDLLADKRKIHFDFEAPVNTDKEAIEALEKLAQ